MIEYSNLIKIRPWVGKNYGQGIFKKKIFLMAESHYWDPEKRKMELDSEELLSFTEDTISCDWRFGIECQDPWTRFFKKITKILSNKYASVMSM